MNLGWNIKFYERFLEIYMGLKKGSLIGKIKILKIEKNKVILLVKDKEVIISINGKI